MSNAASIESVRKLNPIFEYYVWICNNRGKVCDKVYRVYRELVRLLNDSKSEWIYDEKRANHAITFIEKYCKQSKGKHAGKTLKLELWQLAAVCAIFGIVHKETGLRKFREVLLVVGRKNGKSTFCAAIGLYLMIADGEGGAEVYAVATKRDQAKIIWLEAKKMVKKSPMLLRKIKPLVGELNSDYNDSVFKPLGRDSNTQDGLNVHGGLLDEIHAWESMEMYDVIVDGTSARDEPLIFMLTTAGTVRNGIYDAKYDEAELTINGYNDENGYKNERFLPLIYELDNRKEWENPEAWYKANPGLGTIKNYDTLKDKVEAAKRDPKKLKNLLCKEFNIRETVAEAWLTFEQLNNEALFDLNELKPRYGIGGVDLSITTDLTCATVIFMVPKDDHIYVLQMYFLPEDLLESREKDDKIPYSIWRDLGLLRTTPGNKVDKKYVTEWFLEVQRDYDIYLYKCGYDSYSAQYWVDEMKSYFGEETLEPVIQGKKTLSGPMHALAADLEAKRIVYNNNPILKWCLSNVAIETDKNLNIQPYKVDNKRRRIDGFSGLINAYVVLLRNYENYLGVI